MPLTQRKFTTQSKTKPIVNPYAPKPPTPVPDATSTQPNDLIEPSSNSPVLAASQGTLPSNNQPSLQASTSPQPPPNVSTRMSQPRYSVTEKTSGQKKSHLAHYDRVQTCAADFTISTMEKFARLQIAPPSTLTDKWSPETAQVDNVKGQMMESLTRYVGRVTHHEFDSETNGSITLPTLVLYVGTVVDTFKAILKDCGVQPFAQLFHDTGGDTYTGFRNWIQSNWNKAHFEGKNSLGKMDYKCFTLPRTYHGQDSMVVSEGGIHNISELTKKVSLLSINGALFRKGKFKECLTNSFNYHCVGRACEPSLASYERMAFHHILNSTVIGWFQSKTGFSTPLTILPDYEHFEVCVFNGLGCLWMLEDGLFRDGGDDKTKVIEFRNAHMIFSSPLSADKVNRVIKDSLPDGVTISVTNKSIRRGAASHMANTPGISYLETLARGGWSTGTNMDVYLEWAIAQMMPSILSLAGYPDIRMKAVNPSTGCLGEQRRQQCYTYIEFLFPNKLPVFKRGGRLFPVRNIVLATMIMNFNEMLRKYGPAHPVTQNMMLKWDQASCEVPKEDARVVLQEMSSLLRHDFNTRVKESAMKASVDPGLLQAFHAQTESMQQVLQGMREREQDNQQQFDLLSERFTRLEQENISLRQSIGELLSSISLPSTKTPASPSKSVKRAAQISPADDDGQHHKKMKATEVSGTSATPATKSYPIFNMGKKSGHKTPLVQQRKRPGQPQPAAQPAARITTTMVQHYPASPILARKTSAKPVELIARVIHPPRWRGHKSSLGMHSYLGNILEWEYQENSFARAFPFSRITTNRTFQGDIDSSNANKYRTALNVAFQLLSPQQQKWLCTDTWPDDELKRREAFRDVEILFVWFDAMMEETREINRKIKPSVSGVCNRISKSKKWKEKFGKFDKFSSLDEFNENNFPFEPRDNLCMRRAAEDYCNRYCRKTSREKPSCYVGVANK